MVQGAMRTVISADIQGLWGRKSRREKVSVAFQELKESAWVGLWSTRKDAARVGWRQQVRIAHSVPVGYVQSFYFIIKQQVDVASSLKKRVP